jgi:hypothetical protein
VLEEFQRPDIGMILHRFANLTHISEFLKNKTNLTDQQVLRILAVRGRRLSAALNKAPFRRKRWLNGNYGRPTRFSDGTWPTFYAGLHEETARREAGHHYAKAAAEAADEPTPVYYSRINCKFQGSHINLWPKLGAWDLISDDYTFCQSLGKEAWATNLGAFLTPSARHRPDGSNVPAFQSETISDVVVTGTARFTFNPATGSFSVALV